MDKIVIKDTTNNRYFKSNKSGWSGEFLKVDGIVWSTTPQKAAKYSVKSGSMPVKFVIDALNELFPSIQFEQQVVKISRHVA